MHVNQTRRDAAIPDVFLTSDCIALYAIVLHAKIGRWLVEHQAYWLGIEFTATGVVFDSTFGDIISPPTTLTLHPRYFQQRYSRTYEHVKEWHRDSLYECGNYTQADLPYQCVPRLLFGAGELLGCPLATDESASASDVSGGDGVVKENCDFFSGFSLNWITEQETLYKRALYLHTALPANAQSKAAPVHDLFPFHLAITGPSGPWPLVHIRGLLDAYNWAKSPSLVDETRRVGFLPAFFLTDYSIAIYVLSLRARIGKWLVDHQEYWLGLEFTATGLAPNKDPDCFTERVEGMPKLASVCGPK